MLQGVQQQATGPFFWDTLYICEYISGVTRTKNWLNTLACKNWDQNIQNSQAFQNHLGYFMLWELHLCLKVKVM